MIYYDIASEYSRTAKFAPQLVAELDILTNLANDGIILLTQFTLTAQIAPEQHGDKDDEHRDDSDEQDGC